MVKAWFSRQSWLTLHANCSRMAGVWDDQLNYVPKEETREVNGVTEMAGKECTNSSIRGIAQGLRGNGATSKNRSGLPG